MQLSLFTPEQIDRLDIVGPPAIKNFVILALEAEGLFVPSGIEVTEVKGPSYEFLVEFKEEGRGLYSPLYFNIVDLNQQNHTFSVFEVRLVGESKNKAVKIDIRSSKLFSSCLIPY